MTLVFLIASLHPAYTAGEPIYVTLSLRNTGTAAVRVPRPNSKLNWQPVFTISGPGPADRTVVDFRRGIHRDVSLESPSNSTADLLDLAPGATWEGVLEVEDLAPIEKPGSYRLQAVLEWDGSRVESNVAAFAFGHFAAREISLGLWGNPPGSSIVAVWLQAGGDGQTVLEEQFKERGGEDPQMTRSGVARRASVSSNALNPVTQNAPYGLLEDVFRWAFWRAGGKLYGLPTVLSEPLELVLPAGVDSVLSPALLDRSHAADLYLIAGPAESRHLLVARFTDPMEPGAEPPRVLGEIALPALAVAVASDPSGKGDRRHIAAVAVRGRVVRFYHLAYAGAALPAQFTIRDIEASEDLRSLPDSPPAVFVESDGSARVSMVVRSTKVEARCLLGEARFGAGAESPGTLTTVELPQRASATRIGYFQENGGPLRRDWAAWTADGSLYELGEGGRPRLARSHLAPGQPRQLVVLRERSYILETSPTAGVMLNPL